MTKSKIKEEPYNVVDGQYTKITNPFEHVCCDCGSRHKVALKYVSRKVFKIKFVKVDAVPNGDKACR